MFETLLLIIAAAVCIFAAVMTFRNKISFFRGICISVLALVVSFVLSVLYEKTVYNISPIDYAINYTFENIKQLISSQPEILKLLLPGADSADASVQAAAVVESAKQMYTMLFPAFMIISYSFLVFLFFMVIKTVRRIFKKDVSFIPAFNEFSVSKPVLAAFVLSMALGFLLSDTVAGSAFANIQLIISSYFMLCGAALVDFYLAARIPHGAVRLLLYVGVFVMGGGFFVLILEIASFAAILDAFFHFRSRHYA